MEPQTPAPVTPVMPVSPVVAATKASKMPWIIAGGLGIIVLVLVGVVGFLALNALNQQSQNNNQTPAPVASGQTGETNDDGATNPTSADHETLNPTPSVFVDFYTGPFTQADTTTGDLKLVNVTLPTSTSAEDPYYQSIRAILAGPSSAQAATGMRTSFSLAGTSNCAGDDFVISAGASATDLVVKFCKDIDTSIQQSTSSGGGYAGITLRMGGNVIEQVRQSLLDNGAATVSVKDKTGACYMPDSGANVDCN